MILITKSFSRTDPEKFEGSQGFDSTPLCGEKKKMIFHNDTPLLAAGSFINHEINRIPEAAPRQLFPVAGLFP